MAPPVLKRKYIDMVPEFQGDNKLLPRFIEICEKLVTKFYNTEDPSDFQNEYLMSSILAKIKGEAAVNIASCPISCWSDVKTAFLNTYSDKRDCYTLNIEMSELKQNYNETPFDFYRRVQDLLNLQISYLNSHVLEGAATVLTEYFRQYALRILLRGLKEPLGTLMRTKNPSDLNSALNMLTNDFQLVSVIRHHSKPNINTNTSKPKQTPNISTNKQIQQFSHFQQKTNPQPMYRPNPQYTNNFNSYRTAKQNTTNMFKPNPNKNLPKPTPMSVSTRQTFTPKPGPSQYRPQQSYPVQRRPDFIAEELYNTQIDEIPPDDTYEQPFEDENTEYYVTEPNIDEQNDFLSITASEEQM